MTFISGRGFGGDQPDTEVQAQDDRTGTLNENVTTLGSEVLVGGFVFDGLNSPGSLSPILYRMQAALNTGGQADAELRLYDLGAPGSLGAGTLRSTLSISAAQAGSVLVVEKTLSVVAAPGVNADEIFDARSSTTARAATRSTSRGAVW